MNHVSLGDHWLSNLASGKGDDFSVLPVILVAFPIVTSAHHSRAEYTGEPIEFEGSLVGILWRNPHPAFTVEVDENGQSQTWHVTTTDPQTFTDPATAEHYWLALGESFGQYDCNVH